MYLEIRILDHKKAEDAVREIRRIVSRGPQPSAPSPRPRSGQDGPTRRR